MKPSRNLRLRLRLIEGALVLTLAALTTAAVATRQLLLDASNRPTADVSLSSAHWLGTLDAARLPAAVNFSTVGALAPGAGNFTALSSDGLKLDPAANAGGTVGGYINTTAGGRIDTSNNGGPILTIDGGYIQTTNGGGCVDTSDGGGSVVTSEGGGGIQMTNGGGYLQTNGYGAPNDDAAPIGSIYTDQDPAGGSGHVLWIREPAGWVGK